MSDKGVYRTAPATPGLLKISRHYGMGHGLVACQSLFVDKGEGWSGCPHFCLTSYVNNPLKVRSRQLGWGKKAVWPLTVGLLNLWPDFSSLS